MEVILIMGRTRIGQGLFKRDFLSLIIQELLNKGFKPKFISEKLDISLKKVYNISGYIGKTNKKLASWGSTNRIDESHVGFSPLLKLALLVGKIMPLLMDNKFTDEETLGFLDQLYFGFRNIGQTTMAYDSVLIKEIKNSSKK